MNSNQYVESSFLTLFPPPSFLTELAPGVDISDHTIKFLRLKRDKKGLLVDNFAERKISEDIVVGGEIKNVNALAKELRALKEEFNLDEVRGSLPEEKAYLFETTVSVDKGLSIHDSLEFHLEEHVPLSASNAVFDYDVLRKKGSNKFQVGVAAMPTEVVDNYNEAFEKAGLSLLSLEIEAQALARAVVPERIGNRPVMIIDLGRSRTGVSVVSGDVTRFTSTIQQGGNTLSRIISKELSINSKEAQDKKEKEGLNVGSKELSEKLREAVEEWRSEIRRHLDYWNIHVVKERGVQSIADVILCGGNATVPGLKKELSRGLDARTTIADVWTNAFSVDEVVPPIDFGHSLGYATAIGLALRVEN